MNKNKSNEDATNEILITTKNSNSQEDNDKEILNKCTKDQVIFLYGKLKERSLKEISQLKAENEKLKDLVKESILILSEFVSYDDYIQKAEEILK